MAPVGGDAAAQQKWRDLWADWWKAHGERADLSLLRSRPAELGLTLLSLWDSAANQNYLVEMGRDKKHRWRTAILGVITDVDRGLGASAPLAVRRALRDLRTRVNRSKAWRKRKSLEAEIAASQPQSIRYIEHEKNGGKGAALRTGIAHVTGDLVVKDGAKVIHSGVVGGDAIKLSNG